MEVVTQNHRSRLSDKAISLYHTRLGAEAQGKVGLLGSIVLPSPTVRGGYLEIWQVLHRNNISARRLEHFPTNSVDSLSNWVSLIMS